MSLDHAVLGFRQWNIGDDGLQATVYSESTWQPGVNTATCGNDDDWCCEECSGPYDEWLASHQQRKHQAPDAECGCGLYAWHTLDMLKSKQSGDQRTIYGAVAGWGKVFAHNTGWRAEKARILAVSTTAESELRQGFARLVADMYKVPLVPFDMLQLEGARHAGAIPNDMIPAAPEVTKKKPGWSVASYDQLLKDVFKPAKFTWTESVLAPSRPQPSTVPTYNIGDLLNELDKQNKRP